MEIELKKIAKEIMDEIPDLITRPVGRKLYSIVCENLKRIVENEILEINFEDIKVIDTSCIDEFLVRLIIDSREGPILFFSKLTNISDIIELNIDSVFKSYYSSNNQKIVVITDRLMNNNSFYVGYLSPVERDIINYLNVNRAASSLEIAEFLDIKHGDSVDIMEELHSLRLVEKKFDDKEELYLSL